MHTSSTSWVERWSATENADRRSTSSPQRSMRTGWSSVDGYTSTIEPRTASSPRASTWYSRRYPPATSRATSSSRSTRSPGRTTTGSTSSTCGPSRCTSARTGATTHLRRASPRRAAATSRGGAGPSSRATATPARTAASPTPGTARPRRRRGTGPRSCDEPLGLGAGRHREQHRPAGGDVGQRRPRTAPGPRRAPPPSASRLMTARTAGSSARSGARPARGGAVVSVTCANDPGARGPGGRGHVPGIRSPTSGPAVTRRIGGGRQLKRFMAASTPSADDAARPRRRPARP